MSSLVPKSEAHDEDGRDSMERVVPGQDERFLSVTTIISCRWGV